MEYTDMQIIKKNVNELVPYENNPRHNDDAVEYVANSIKEFGFKVPIIIDKDNVIVAGHTRLKAAKKLGMQYVPCILANDLSEEQVRAFRLADNKVGEFSTWDNDLLQIELDNLLDIDMEKLGFEIKEIDDDNLINDNDELPTTKFDYVLKINDLKVYMTEEESDEITKLLKLYTEENTVTFGFVKWLCERKNNGIC